MAYTEIWELMKIIIPIKKYEEKLMKTLIKKMWIFQYIRWIRYLYLRKKRVNRNHGVVFDIRSLFKVRVYRGKKRYIKLLSKTNLDKTILNVNQYFYYSIDEYKTVEKTKRIIGNLSIDYSKVTDFPMKSMLETCDEEQRLLLEALHDYALRNVVFLKKNSSEKYEKAIESLERIYDEKASGFQDALQRILFINGVIWQCGHRLVGLGRLDKILAPYYMHDIRHGVITESSARKMVKEFLVTLHRNYWFKGDMISGDTGQIIILGGLNEKNEYECNELTTIYIELIKELNIPDPKILLRVSKKMPRELMETAVSCVQTGVGSPLFANDDVIIETLIQYGYGKGDSYNYVTSACWEPTIAGKSSEQNNCEKINYVAPLTQLFYKIREMQIDNLTQLKCLYFELLDSYIEKKIETIAGLGYQKAPVLSIFIQRKNKEDISDKSAVYNDYGVTTVGLSNVVNSFLVIKRIVWDRHDYSLCEIVQACCSNFKDKEILRNRLKDECSSFWSHDDIEVIQLTNEIIKKANDAILLHQKKYNLQIKIGMSSPDYIVEGKKTEATPDGRKKGEPLGVHISSENGQAYTEIVNFAAALNTNGCNINGNVVDLMVSPGFINSNFDKFVDFLFASIQVGFYELQMNVVSSQRLIEAKNDPEKFPNLIVRVWGFSAYFNELPEEYKDILIERALKNENVN